MRVPGINGHSGSAQAFAFGSIEALIQLVISEI
jgi:hypothetical protein